MDRYQQLRVFVAVAATMGFASAARRSGLSASQVTRAVVALEERIGVRLFNRSTREVSLTEAGLRFLADAKRILADMDIAEKSVAGLHARPHGLLTVSAPVLFGQNLLAPIILDYLNGHADVRLHAMFADRVPNLHDEGIDVAIVMGALPDSSMVALRIGAVRRVICIAPAYQKRQGTPGHPRDLADHKLVFSTADAQAPEWRFVDAGEAMNLRLSPRLTVSNNQAAIEAATAGWGVTRVMSHEIAPQLADGSLRIVLADFEPPAIATHLVYREGARASAKVRSFVDFAVARLRAHEGLR